MARRKKISETGIRKSTKHREYDRKEIRSKAEEYGTRSERKKEKSDLSGLKTAAVSIMVLLAILVVNSIRTAKGGEKTPAAENCLRVHYIDVGQGDCIYLESGGENMLIDCGEASQADNVCSYLKKLGVKSIDYVIGSHFHSDHIGGMSEIVKSYDIGEFIVPPFSDENVPADMYFERFLDALEQKKIRLKKAKPERRGRLGDAEWVIVAPVSEDYTETNNSSVGIVVCYGDNKFFFSGDAEAEAERDIVNAYEIGHIDVYKAGHHGSGTSSTDILLDEIKPDKAVISCGAGNPYGHPDKNALARIRRYTDEIYRTDISGTIVMSSDGKEIKVQTERNAGW